MRCIGLCMGVRSTRVLRVLRLMWARWQRLVLSGLVSLHWKAVRFVRSRRGKLTSRFVRVAGWFLFHSMHSLCGIIGSCRTLLSLNLSFPTEATAWTQSLCQSLIDVRPFRSPSLVSSANAVLCRTVEDASHPRQGSRSL